MSYYSCLRCSLSGIPFEDDDEAIVCWVMKNAQNLGTPRVLFPVKECVISEYNAEIKEEDVPHIVYENDGGANFYSGYRILIKDEYKDVDTGVETDTSKMAYMVLVHKDLFKIHIEDKYADLLGTIDQYYPNLLQAYNKTYRSEASIDMSKLNTNNSKVILDAIAKAREILRDQFWWNMQTELRRSEVYSDPKNTFWTRVFATGYESFGVENQFSRSWMPDNYLPGPEEWVDFAKGLLLADHLAFFGWIDTINLKRSDRNRLSDIKKVMNINKRFLNQKIAKHKELFKGY